MDRLASTTNLRESVEMAFDMTAAFYQTVHPAEGVRLATEPTQLLNDFSLLQRSLVAFLPDPSVLGGLPSVADLYAGLNPELTIALEWDSARVPLDAVFAERVRRFLNSGEAPMSANLVPLARVAVSAMTAMRADVNLIRMALAGSPYAVLKSGNSTTALLAQISDRALYTVGYVATRALTRAPTFMASLVPATFEALVAVVSETDIAVTEFFNHNRGIPRAERAALISYVRSRRLESLDLPAHATVESEMRRLAGDDDVKVRAFLVTHLWKVCDSWRKSALQIVALSSAA